MSAEPAGDSGQELVDRAAASRFHLRLLIVCAVILFPAGYAIGLYGPALPAARVEFGISGVFAGAIETAMLLGMLIGSLLLGAAGDRVGRRPVLILGIVLISLGCLLAALSPAAAVLLLARLMMGIGIEATLTLASAAAGDYAPVRWRATFTMWVGVGFAIGTASATLVASGLLETGWRSLMLTGTAAVVVIPLIIILPEPLHLLLPRRPAAAAQILQQLRIDLAAPSVQRDTPTAPQRAGFADLFSRRYRFRTLLIGAAFASCLLSLYGLVTWVPAFLVQAGYQLESGAAFLALVNADGIAGIILTGWISTRAGVFRTTLLAYALTSVLLLTLGLAPSAAILAILLLSSGVAGNAAAVSQIAYAGSAFPPRLRATAIGWGLGAG